MKILYVVKNLRVANGVSSYVMNYYRELMKYQNVEIDFLIVKDAGSPYYEEMKENNSKILFLPSLNKPVSLCRFLKRIFKEGKYDILHSNVFNSDSLIAYYAKKAGVPVRILHSHAAENGYTLIKKIRNKPFQYLSMKFSNIYFACSNLAGEKIFNKKKFYVVNNAINLEKFYYNQIERRIIRNKYKVSDDKYVIATVGRITEPKNPYFILKIIKDLSKKNINFIFWWFGNGNLDKKVMDKAKELKIDDKIVFWGSVNDMHKYYSAFDLFILPSLSEGLPVVGIEAQVNGVKCIMSNTISKEVAIAESTDLISISDESVWCDQIINTIRPNRQYENRKIDVSNYDIKELSKKMYNLYDEILKKF